jgi:hypothetical protein
MIYYTIREHYTSDLDVKYYKLEDAMNAMRNAMQDPQSSFIHQTERMFLI